MFIQYNNTHSFLKLLCLYENIWNLLKACDVLCGRLKSKFGWHTNIFKTVNGLEPIWAWLEWELSAYCYVQGIWKIQEPQQGICRHKWSGRKEEEYAVPLEIMLYVCVLCSRVGWFTVQQKNQIMADKNWQHKENHCLQNPFLHKINIEVLFISWQRNSSNFHIILQKLSLTHTKILYFFIVFLVNLYDCFNT